MKPGSIIVTFKDGWNESDVRFGPFAKVTIKDGVINGDGLDYGYIDANSRPRLYGQPDEFRSVVIEAVA